MLLQIVQKNNDDIMHPFIIWEGETTSIITTGCDVLWICGHNDGSTTICFNHPITVDKRNDYSVWIDKVLSEAKV